MTLPKLDSFQSLDGLPSLPGQIVGFLDEIGGVSANDYNILHRIQYDPAIALTVLKLANAPLYGFRSKIVSLQQAAALVGPGAIKNLVLMTPILERYQDSGQVALNIDYPNLWLHLAVTAGIASGLGKRIEGMEPDVCFTAGLIHGAGKIALATQHPELLAKVLRNATSRNVSLRESEKEILGFTDSDVAAALARAWRFPDVLTVALEQGCNSREEGITEKLPAVLCLARLQAAQWGYPDTLIAEENGERDDLLDLLGVSGGEWDAWQSELHEYADLAARSQGV